MCWRNDNHLELILENTIGYFTEKRAYKRVSVDAETECEIFSVESQMLSLARKKNKYKFNVANLCLDGMQIITDKMISAEEILRMKVIFRDFPEIIWVYSQVRWSRFDSELNKYRTGVQFFYLKEKYRKICEQIIERAVN